VTRSRGFAIVAGALVAAVMGCHTITEQTPSSPTPVSLVPLIIPVVGAPTPAPTPTPTPTPKPGATPTPAPSPTPTPPPSGSTCSLPPSNPANPQCVAESQSFLKEVDQSIDRVTQLFPGLFDFNNTRCTNCYFVKDIDRYAAEVVKELGRRGLCAAWDGEEVGVKSKNAFNDQYDIILSSGHIRRGDGSYRVTCRPAVF
jgi:hypothetical protein